jgi:peptidoglycan/LPS O-acetylase OafA/YrhL
LVLTYSKWSISSRVSLALYTVASSILLAACLAAARTGASAVLGNNLSVGIAFSVFLFAVLQIKSGAASGYYHQTARLLAGFSYSLYVLHFPFLLFLRAWLAPWQRWQPDALHLVYGLGIGTATLGFAWLVSLVTEARTSTARRRMRSILPRLDSRLS